MLDQKERFQSTQKVGKKSKMVAGNGSIVLPASQGMQVGAQLKAQLNKGGHMTHQNKATKSQLQSGVMNQTSSSFGNHQRMNSLPDSSQIGANLQRGFNSASHAGQVMQIYQQSSNHNAPTNNSSTKQAKYSNQAQINSRKMLP